MRNSWVLTALQPLNYLTPQSFSPPCEPFEDSVKLVWIPMRNNLYCLMYFKSYYHEPSPPHAPSLNSTFTTHFQSFKYPCLWWKFKMKNGDSYEQKTAVKWQKGNLLSLLQLSSHISLTYGVLCMKRRVPSSLLSLHGKGKVGGVSNGFVSPPSQESFNKSTALNSHGETFLTIASL